MSAEELVADGCKTVAAAVEFSGIGRSELYNLMAAGELKYLMNGSRRLIPVRELRRLLAERLMARQQEGN